jgi:ABC-type polysaccharide/polyol phosphate transport system ATPase subunit
MTLVDREIAIQPEETEVVISVENVSKKFCRDLRRSLLYGVRDIATELTGGKRNQTLRSKEFWALKDVNFKLRRGQAIGLVGANGAGKSTLLRIISGLIKPDIGIVKIKGRVAPLIALGAGFNPLLTGRENIYANMSILGLSTKEIAAKFQEVIDFAEIWDAIDTPVQNYSSGMAARLGFACAIHTEPEILLIDEVLAVGDIKFKAKCYRQLHQLRQQGTSFVLVNHNSQAILNVCDSAIYLVKGELIASDDPKTVIEKYEEDLFMDSQKKNSEVMYLPEKSASESFGLDLIHLFFRDAEGKILESLKSGEPTSFCVGCRAHKKFDNVTLHLKITELGGEGGTGTVLFLSGENDEKSFEVLPGKHEIQLQMPYLGLAPGTYTMSIKLKQSSIYTFDVFESFRFTVRSDGRMSQCKFYQPRSWQLKQTDIKDDSKGAF